MIICCVRSLFPLVIAILDLHHENLTSKLETRALLQGCQFVFDSTRRRRSAACSTARRARCDRPGRVLRTRRVHVHDASNRARVASVPPAAAVLVIPVAPVAGGHTVRAAPATATPAPPAPAPAAPASRSSPPTSACIMLSRPMRSLPFLTRRERPAALSTARAFHPRLNDSRGHQLLKRDVRLHAAMYHPIVRPRQHESSSTAGASARELKLARAAAERHEGADDLQRQAAAAARLALPTRPCGKPKYSLPRRAHPCSPRALPTLEPRSGDRRPSPMFLFMLRVSFYATFLKCRLKWRRQTGDRHFFLATDAYNTKQVPCRRYAS